MASSRSTPETAPLSISQYEKMIGHISRAQTSRSQEYSKVFASSGQLASTLAPGRDSIDAVLRSSYAYPDVDDLSAVRRSLESNVRSGMAPSIWSAARETSQSLEFDVRSSSSRRPVGDPFRPPNPYYDGPSEDRRRHHDLPSAPSSAAYQQQPPPPPSASIASASSSQPRSASPRGDRQNVPPPAPKRSSADPPLSAAAKSDLEKKLLKLEQENQELRRSQKELTVKAEEERWRLKVEQQKLQAQLEQQQRAIKSNHQQQHAAQSRRSIDVADPFSTVRSSSSAVPRSSVPSAPRPSSSSPGGSSTRARGPNLSSSINSTASDASMRRSRPPATVFEPPPTVPEEHPSSPSTRYLHGGHERTRERTLRESSESPTRRAQSPQAKRREAELLRRQRQQQASATGTVMVPTTRAEQLRVARRQALNAASADDPQASASLFTSAYHNKDGKKEWSTLGPHLRDQSTIQRVEMQRSLGEDPKNLSLRINENYDERSGSPIYGHRRSRDFDRMCEPSVKSQTMISQGSVDLTRNDGQPIDWSLLMGTMERKAVVTHNLDRRDDQTYNDVQFIAAHCRGKDRMSAEAAALLPRPDEMLPVPKEGSINVATGLPEKPFKKRIARLMNSLKGLLEHNSEKQVKYVAFKQRCNLHKKDLETVLSRRALATMAYAFGAVDGPHLDFRSWERFLRAFFADKPDRFPISSDDLRHLWQICDAGDTALLGEMVFVEPYIERNQFGFEYTEQCWGKKREGIMCLRSAGFEKEIKDDDDVPSKVTYAYSRSTVGPWSDWDKNDIKRSTQVPTPTLDLERVYGCLGKTICPNLYEAFDGRVIFTAAAVAVIQNLETGGQQFYNHHTDDITCLTVHRDGKIAATGQMGKPCYALVWNVETLETLYHVGEGYFERMLECLAISPNSQYLVGVGGDNNQSMAVYDLKAVNEQGENVPAIVAEEQVTPGVPPMMTFMEWKPGENGGTTFVGVAKGRLLKFWDFEPGKRASEPADPNVAAGEATGPLSGRKGISKLPGTRDVREYTCAAWSNDGELFLTGTDQGDVWIWKDANHIDIIQVYDKPAPGKSFTSVTACAFTVEGSKLYTGGSDGKLKVWSYPDPKQLDEHNLNLSRAELATKCGGDSSSCSAVVKKPKAKGIPGAPKEESRSEKPLPANKAITNIVTLDRPKILKGEDGEQAAEQVAVITERGMLLNVWDDVNGDTQFKSIMASHYGEVSGFGRHPIEEGIFATVGEDGILNIWSANEKRILKTSELPHPARAVCFSPDGAWVAVGYCDGYLGVYDSSKLRERTEHHTLSEDIDQIKFSPDGRWLAAGSHDNFIDIFDCQKGFKFRNRFKGHTSFITHLDFSKDSKMLMSNCAASEILYWDIKSGKQLRLKSDMPNDPNDPATWGRQTCILGFAVMGIWPDFADGTDINALDVNEKGDVCVTADDYGEVKLFNYPCVTEDAAYRAYRGHSSHVTNVGFVWGDSHVISCGAADLTVMQWRFTYSTDKLKPIKNAFAKMQVLNAFSPKKKKDQGEEEVGADEGEQVEEEAEAEKAKSALAKFGFGKKK